MTSKICASHIMLYSDLSIVYIRCLNNFLVVSFRIDASILFQILVKRCFGSLDEKVVLGLS